MGSSTARFYPSNFKESLLFEYILLMFEIEKDSQLNLCFDPEKTISLLTHRDQILDGKDNTKYLKIKNLIFENKMKVLIKRLAKHLKMSLNIERNFFVVRITKNMLGFFIKKHNGLILDYYEIDVYNFKVLKYVVIQKNCFPPIELKKVETNYNGGVTFSGSGINFLTSRSIL